MSKEYQGKYQPETIVNLNNHTIGVGSEIKNDPFLWKAMYPEKIASRLQLNSSGLNTLPTVFIYPNAGKSLDIGRLSEILTRMNRVGKKIGLPETENMIVRSSLPETYSQNGFQRTMRISEPAFLFNGSETGQNLTDGIRCNWSDFRRVLPDNVFFLAHQDHYQLQLASLHGRITNFNFGYELVVATGTKHARDIETSEDKNPVLKLSVREPEDIFGVDHLEARYQLETGRRSPAGFGPELVPAGNWPISEFARLFRLVHKNARYILAKYDRAREIFGRDIVMEFRVYPEDATNMVEPVQVLDVDQEKKRIR